MRASLKLWMGLGGEIKRMVNTLNKFNQTSIWRFTGNPKPTRFDLLDKCPVYFIAVAMALGNLTRTIRLLGQRAEFQLCDIIP